MADELVRCDNVHRANVSVVTVCDVKPLYIKVHPSDNVAIIVNPDGLPAATEFADGLTLKERIPQAHKVALRDLQRGDPVRRYGQIIGFAARPIAVGSWVHEDAIENPSRPPFTNCLWRQPLLRLSQP
jgi:galactarate dehydratase